MLAPGQLPYWKTLRRIRDLGMEILTGGLQADDWRKLLEIKKIINQVSNRVQEGACGALLV